MQRFLSLRLLSKNHPTSNGPSYIYNTFVSLAESNLLYTKKAHACSVSQYSTTALSHPWVKRNKFFGFLANPVVVNKVLQKSNALLKAPSTGLLDFKWVIPRSYFLQKRSFSSSSVKSPYSPVRKWFRRVDPDNLILVLIAANIAVFLMWRKADRQFMMENFTISVDNFKSGRLHTLITSAFSHFRTGHIVSNMLGLYVFGTSIGSAFGPEFLLKLYLAGALGGSVCYLVYHAFLIPSKSKQMGGRSPSSVPGLGSSGALNAIMLFEILLNPKRIIFVEMILPVPALLAGVYLIGTDMLRVIKGDTRVSGSAHLGGAAVGVMAWLQFRIREFHPWGLWS